MSGPTKAEHLARQVEGCMTGGKLFTRQLMTQVRDELRRLDAELEPLRRAQERASAKNNSRKERP